MADEKTQVRSVDTVIRQFRDGQSSGGKYSLIVISGENVGKIFPLKPPKATIGRGSECDVYIMNSSISREHALIEYVGQNIIIRDLGSTNGTFINGQRVQSQYLNDGDKVQIGVSTVMKFAFQDSMESEFQQNLYESATKDPLTGAYNKRHFTERINAEFNYALRHVQQIALVMLDIDFFKQVNDIYGHLAGDAVLKEFSRRIMINLRAGDLFCRYGGEEFAVIVRDCPKENFLRLRLFLQEICL